MMSDAQTELCESVWGKPMPPRINDDGLYFPMCREGKGCDDGMSARVVGINDDDTLNLTVWNSQGQNRPVLNVPTEQNADDDGVHFFRKRGDL
jgi:hypothetical protein